MKKKNSKRKNYFYILNYILIFTFCIFILSVFAQENLEEICKIEKIEEQCSKLEPTDCRNLLEKCEVYYTEQNDAIEKDLSKTEQEKKTLQNKIDTLKKKIKNLDYQIYQSNLIIKDLGIQIGDTEASVVKTSLKTEDSKSKLANILRTIYEEDQKPIIEILIAENNLSDFFDNLTALEVLNTKSKELLQNIKILKSNLENQKQSLDEEKDDLERMVKLQTLQKEESSKTQKEQEYYLKLTEKEYQNYLQKKEEVEKKAAEIRSRIFELIGVPKAPTFGEAYEIAKSVEKITGVRPAFLLAVLTQESNIGKNVGQCYLRDVLTGAGIFIRTEQATQRVMSPKRDIPSFLQITKELGRDSFNTSVSCPMSYGWGGAMGPAQFIPSTWMIYRDRLKEISGKPVDPWNVKDAFLAAGLYLSDYGAVKQTYNGEWQTAMIYFSGTTNSKYRFYGDSVMKITKQYEEDIAELEDTL